MQARGYSLVEMVVIVGIISILLVIGTLKFREYFTRYRTESQTRMLFSELQRTRANALYQRRATRVKLYASRFEVYSSKADCDSGVAPRSSQSLSLPITWSQNGNNVDFDENGIASVPRSICLESCDGAGTVDSVVVHFIRVSVGKKDKGDLCRGESISIR